jgi:hypothetical protein
MENVPKIVRDRLQRGTPVTAESHPDADLLTAFAEQSLTGRERDHVLQHLALCGDCREAVVLALPGEVELLKPAAGGTNWLRWPGLHWSVLRWAAVAAGMVLIASVGIVQYRGQRSRVASNVFPEKPVITADQKEAIATPAQSPKPSSPVAAPQTAMPKDKLAAPRAQTALTAKNPAPAAAATFNRRTISGDTVARGYAGRGSAGAAFSARAGHSFTSGGSRGDVAFAPAPQSPAAAKQNPAPSPPQSVGSSPSTTVEVSAAAPLIATETTGQNQIQDQVAQNEPAEPSADQSAVVRAKPTSAPGAPVSMTPAPMLHSPSLMKSPATPRWTISANGTLQRSLDGGQTWLDVNLAAGSMSSNPAPRAQNEVVTTEARSAARTVTETNAETKTEKKLDADAKARSDAPPAAKSANAGPAASAPTVFRALSVSSNAGEVWAGGSAGALYHTLDGGNVWVRVVPSAAGVALTGDVVSIQFSDPRNGTVATSNAEIWTTNDDGQTWQKRH